MDEHDLISYEAVLIEAWLFYDLKKENSLKVHS